MYPHGIPIKLSCSGNVKIRNDKIAYTISTINISSLLICIRYVAIKFNIRCYIFLIHFDYIQLEW